jgi:DNA (cytosine-5)-methyltransferase 1
MLKHKKEHRINLRLPGDTHEAIERLRFEGNGKVSYNAWVAQAILEKIERDSARRLVEPPRAIDNQRTFYEFFAGGGMARLGLGDEWCCLFANDFDPSKARAYRENWGGSELLVEDVKKLRTNNLPGAADMVWASFPARTCPLPESTQASAAFATNNSPVRERFGRFGSSSISSAPRTGSRG